MDLAPGSSADQTAYSQALAGCRISHGAYLGFSLRAALVAVAPRLWLRLQPYDTPLPRRRRTDRPGARDPQSQKQSHFSNQSNPRSKRLNGQTASRGSQWHLPPHARLQLVDRQSGGSLCPSPYLRTVTTVL